MPKPGIERELTWTVPFSSGRLQACFCRGLLGGCSCLLSPGWLLGLAAVRQSSIETLAAVRQSSIESLAAVRQSSIETLCSSTSKANASVGTVRGLQHSYDSRSDEGLTCS